MQVNLFPKKMDRIHQKEIKTQKFNKTLNFLYGDNWLRWAWLSVITRVIVLANLHFCDFFLFFNWKNFFVFFPRQIYLLTARVVRSRKKASSRFFFCFKSKNYLKGAAQVVAAFHLSRWWCVRDFFFFTLVAPPSCSINIQFWPLYFSWISLVD